MKNVSAFVIVVFFSLFFVSCKGSKDPKPQNTTTTSSTNTTPSTNTPTNNNNALGNILNNLADIFKNAGFDISGNLIDTSKVTMKMQLNDIGYSPTKNYTARIPSIYGEQLWINGSTPGFLKVITLQMPPNINVGTYPIQLNSQYDAKYAPTNEATFTADEGKLVIVKHDKTNKVIEGTFEFVATNIYGATQPTVKLKNGSFKARY